MLSNMPGLGDAEEQEANRSADAPSQMEATSPDGAMSDSASAEAMPAVDEAPDAPISPPAEAPTPSESPAAENTSESPVDQPQGSAEGSSSDVEAEPAPSAAPADSTAAAETAATAAPAPSTPTPPGVRRGEVVEGTIVSTSPTSIMVDIGAAKPGIVPMRELERLNRRALEEMQPGQKIYVYVVNPRTPDGEITLSIDRAAEERDWERAEASRESQEPYETKVSGYNKGGLIVRFGRVRGFVPLSQLSPERRRRATSGATPEESLGAMVNEAIVVKVMEVDRQRNRLILSERTATRENRERRKESLISQLEVGEIRTGRVVSLENFGAFVDVGGAEGLVHLTELSWKHVTHPRELLSEGQEVQVEVISIDPDAKRIGLSMRRREPDPWDTVAVDFTQGQLVKGEITKLTKFGAFARLVDLPEIEGLVHISELSEVRVSHPRDVVKEGDVLTLRVVKVDVKNRRLGLSLKRVQSKEYLDMDWPDQE